MLKDFTTLLSTGCSFTAGDKKWSYYVSQHYDLNLINYGQSSIGNGFISRATIYSVDRFLKQHDASKLLVGIMWSGYIRHENFHTNDDRRYSGYTSGFNFINYDITDGVWIKLRHNQIDTYSAPYFRNYFDHIGSYIITLEHILRTQWFLQSRNIEYFMTCYSDDVLPNEQDRNNPNLKYLYDLVDWNKFIPGENCLTWCKKSGIVGVSNSGKTRDDHPSSEQQEGFAKQIIIPFLERKYLGN